MQGYEPNDLVTFKGKTGREFTGRIIKQTKCGLFLVKTIGHANIIERLAKRQMSPVESK